MPALTEQLTALNMRSVLPAMPPGLDDAQEARLTPPLCLRLRAVGVVTLAHLADFIDVHRFRWHTRVAGLGAVRAQRRVAWLAPLVAQIGRPLRDLALQLAWQLALAREPPARHARSGRGRPAALQPGAARAAGRAPELSGR